MSERTTPETNALYAQLLAGNPGYFIHLEEFLELARRLERERDEANYFLKELAEADAQLKVRLQELCEVLQKAEQERDEAREQVNHYRDKLDLLPIKWDI
jgi:uncharacterized coiled-coil DUF342 family protein